MLRLLAISALLSAYLQPSIRVEEVAQTQSVVAIVVDESPSMQARTREGKTRAQAVSEFFRSHGGWLDDLSSRYSLRLFGCSDDLRPLDRKEVEEPLAPRGMRTDIVGCVSKVLNEVPQGQLGGVLLVSDGGDTLAKEVGAREALGRGLRLAKDFTGPFLALVVEERPQDFMDLTISRVSGAEYVLSRNLARIVVAIKAIGIGTGKVEVRLLLDGEVVDRGVADLAEGEPKVSLTFLPEKPGRRVLEVEVDALPGEVSLENNRRFIVANVVRDKVRVLHVAGHPSWDVRFLREYLRGRGDIELVSFHTLREPDLFGPDDGALLIPFPAEEIFVSYIKGFDLLVLQDYELPEVDRHRFAQSVIQYTMEGGAILMFAGDQSFGAFGPWPEHLGPILPVVPGRGSARGMAEGVFRVEVAKGAVGHPVLELVREKMGGRDVAGTLERAQPLSAVVRVGGAAQGAEVVLEAKEASGGQSFPFLVVGRRGKGAVATIMSDTMWRWAFGQQDYRLYKALLDGVIAYITGEPQGPKVRVRRDLVAPFGTVEVEIRSQPKEEVEVRFEGLDGKEVAGRYRLETDEEGYGRLRVQVREMGPYRVVARTQGGAVGSDVFVVGPEAREMEDLRGDEKVLEALAATFQGQVRPISVPGLEGFTPRPASYVRRGVVGEVPLWTHPAVLVSVLVLLGLEWYLERRWAR